MMSLRNAFHEGAAVLLYTPTLFAVGDLVMAFRQAEWTGIAWNAGITALTLASRIYERATGHAPTINPSHFGVGNFRPLKDIHINPSHLHIGPFRPLSH